MTESEIRRRRDEGESHDFILSALVAYATDSALLGGKCFAK